MEAVIKKRHPLYRKFSRPKSLKIILINNISVIGEGE